SSGTFLFLIRKSSLVVKLKTKQISCWKRTSLLKIIFSKDATFELMDAVLLTRKAYSFAELSLSPVFRRKWCSLYEAPEKIIIFNREVLYK
ncbi:MAG: hypothetical protein QNJ54_19620, partial [Prochloraceae cyanobacterium]|nr:hypothetical protein [Prochloraceae cyanobacterium]